MNSPIRVVTIWSTYGDYHVARLKGLTEYGFEVIPFAHCEHDPEYPFFSAKPDSLVVVNRGNRDRINPILSLWRTWRLLRTHRPDIVLTAGYERTESLAACLYRRTSTSRGGRRPVVILMNENRAEDHPRDRLVEWVKSAYLNVFDGFLTSGSASRSYLNQLGVPDSGIEIGYSCVDNDQIAKLVAQHEAASRDAKPKRGYFLCIARLVAKKNIPGIIRAYHSYLRWLPDSEPIQLVICGDGPERGAIEDLIEQLGLGNSVGLVGALQGTEAIAEQLANCKAFVLASTWDETWGLVVNEAMAAGRPVLVSKQCGCAGDLVEPGVNGFTFDGKDSAELARQMLWLHLNGERLEGMGLRSKQIIGRFSTSRFADSASKLATPASRSAVDSMNSIRPPAVATRRGMSSKTRVATIWSTYSDYHIARLAALAAHGFEVIPFAHGDYDVAYPFFRAKPDSLVVVNAGAANRVNSVLSLWRTWRQLRIHRPDVVLTAGYERSESLAACIYARTSRGHAVDRPVVILMLNNRAEDHPRRRVTERVKSIYLRVFDAFLTSGSESRDYLEQLGVVRSMIELGYNCVDNQEIARLVTNHRAMSDGRGAGYFLSIARLIAKKNVPGVVRAYHSYLRALPVTMSPLPLVICGEGPDKGAIEELIRRLGIENAVHLVGEATGLDAVAKQLAHCKALVLASTGDETWGLVVNEAMAAGCPVLVSSQCGCARDLVEQGVNGFTFDGHDSDALARHMLWLHSNQDMIGPMGNKSKEIIDRFTPARFALSASNLARSAGVPSTTGIPIA